MAERKELLAIHQLLRGADEHVEADQMSDLELLKDIVERVKRSGVASRQGDSVAFPAKTRQAINLTTANGLWNQLEQFDDDLRQDYTCRRQMLLRRLDCTIESFKWKSTTASNPDKVRHEPRDGPRSAMNDRIHELYERCRLTIKEEPEINISNLLALREKDCDRLLNGVVSSRSLDCKINYGSKKQQASGQAQVNLKHVIIPNVPDRGGRTDEIRPPPKESFGQQGARFKHGRGRHR